MFMKIKSLRKMEMRWMCIETVFKVFVLGFTSRVLNLFTALQRGIVGPPLLLSLPIGHQLPYMLPDDGHNESIFVNNYMQYHVDTHCSKQSTKL